MKDEAWVTTESVRVGDQRVAVINLWPRESNCGACGVRLVNARCGIPVWEGDILPNSWDGEWGGNDACPPCYEFQQTLTEPMSWAEFLRKKPSSAGAGGKT